jgi:hypothetical protein
MRTKGQSRMVYWTRKSSRVSLALSVASWVMSQSVSASFI